jgi:hypothetical protein
MEKDIEIGKREELRCPHCGEGGLGVRMIQVHHPEDEIELTFGTVPLTFRKHDGGGGCENDGSLVPSFMTLSVYCPRCSPKGDLIFLYITAGRTRVEGDDDVVRVRWSTDPA